LHRSTKGKEKFTVREEEEKGESQRRRKRVSKKSFGVLCVFVHTSLQQKTQARIQQNRAGFHLQTSSSAPSDSLLKNLRQDRWFTTSQHPHHRVD
jgi:hypothetical protein